MTPPASPPQIPQQVPFKSGQYEFTDEHNKTLSGLSDAMRSFANLMKILGLAFVVLLLLAIGVAYFKKEANFADWGPPIGLLPLTVLCLAFGFWSGSSAASFRKIAETKNEDVWNLMGALGSLKNMFGMLRFLMIGTLVLLVVAGAIIGFGLMSAK